MRSVLLAILLTTLGGAVQLAQAESLGGNIGRGQRDLSGETHSTPGHQSRSRNQGGGGACAKVYGKWNSWASLLFGRGDTIFSKGGSVTHSSGAKGRWSCTNGNITILWGHSMGRAETHRISDDGRTITNANGSVGFRR